MSWADPCSYCGDHRADCECGHWGKTKVEVLREEQKKETWIKNVMKIEGFTKELAEETFKRIFKN